MFPVSIMAKAHKRLERLKTSPTDYQWDELVTLLGDFNFSWFPKAGGSSHGIFYNSNTKRKFSISKPHNPTILKRYQITAVLKMLEDDGFI
jgi:hypothetical protein